MIRYFLVALFVFVGATVVHGQATDGKEIVSRFMAAVIPDPGAGREASLSRVVDKYFAVNEFAEKALGEDLGSISAELREAYLRSYRALLVRFIRKRISNLSRDDFQILGLKKGAGQVDLVYSRIKNSSSREHDVIWYVHRGQIVEIAYNGALVTERQRSEFESIISRSADGLKSLPPALDTLDP